MITTKQFGFLKNISTETAISHLAEYLYDALDSRDITCSIFIDLRKAFDSVKHSLLPKKLELYGIRVLALDLMTNYLEDRLHFVRIGADFSDTKISTIGVPQGSILEPLLFLLFINDLPNISNYFHSTLFADDTTITVGDSSRTNLTTKCDEVLDKLFDWTTSNRLNKLR